MVRVCNQPMPTASTRGRRQKAELRFLRHCSPRRDSSKPTGS
jgi:hypothetical protein